MKKHLHAVTISLVFILLGSHVAAQGYHFQEGFSTNAPPNGWLMTNISYSTNHNNGALPGDYSAKMKPNESFIMCPAINTAGSIQFYIKVRDTSSVDDFHIMLEKSYNKIDWTEISKDFCNMENDSVFQLVNLPINDGAHELYIRFHATSVGGTNTLGLCYIDDVSITKLEVSPGDATLTSLSYNGIPVPGFTATNQMYTIEVPYSVTQVAVTGVSNNPSATLSISNPTNLRGYEADRTGTVTVTSQDGTTTLSYKIIFTVSDYIYKIGFVNTGDGVMPLPGWRGGYTYTSVTIPMGDHGLYEGAAALKFMRGQPDKVGYLNSAKYIKSDSLFFWLAVSDPDGVEQLLIEKKVNGGISIPLGLITSADMNMDWKLFAYPVKEEDSTEIIMTPTLTAEGITRIWIDDLCLKGKKVSGLSIPDGEDANQVSLYPNPASREVNILTGKEKYNSVVIRDLTGKALIIHCAESRFLTIDVANLSPGIYFVELKNQRKSVALKFIKR